MELESQVSRAGSGVCWRTHLAVGVVDVGDAVAAHAQAVARLCAWPHPDVCLALQRRHPAPGTSFEPGCALPRSVFAQLRMHLGALHSRASCPERPLRCTKTRKHGDAAGAPTQLDLMIQHNSS